MTCRTRKRNTSGYNVSLIASSTAVVSSGQVTTTAAMSPDERSGWAVHKWIDPGGIRWETTDNLKTD